MIKENRKNLKLKKYKIKKYKMDLLYKNKIE